MSVLRDVLCWGLAATLFIVYPLLLGYLVFNMWCDWKEP